MPGFKWLEPPRCGARIPADLNFTTESQSWERVHSALRVVIAALRASVSAVKLALPRTV